MDFCIAFLKDDPNVGFAAYAGEPTAKLPTLQTAVGVPVPGVIGAMDHAAIVGPDGPSDLPFRSRARMRFI